jgi:hypothetical protein
MHTTHVSLHCNPRLRLAPQPSARGLRVVSPLLYRLSYLATFETKSKLQKLQALLRLYRATANAGGATKGRY